jgi:hypothetical protein
MLRRYLLQNWPALLGTLVQKLGWDLDYEGILEAELPLGAHARLLGGYGDVRVVDVGGETVLGTELRKDVEVLSVQYGRHAAG